MINTSQPPRVASNCGSKLLMALAVTGIIKYKVI